MQHLQVQKWGKGLGIRISRQLAKELNLHVGSPIEIHIENDKLVIRSSRYNLGNLLSKINSKNQHHLLLEGKRLGSERT